MKQKYTEFLLKIESAKVIAPDISFSDYVAIDMSVNSTLLKAENPKTAADYQTIIQNNLDLNNAKIAYGGYLETRNIYKRSAIFANNNTDDRNIHLGLDFWINAPAPVFSALDGEIHSFQNNSALGDYGPTIILKHSCDGFIFYTLYGHLSLESLKDKAVGDKIGKGEQIAVLGLPPINGDYTPHLHFQIIVDMQGKNGDYPGVCSKNDIDFYSENCPDPELLLKIKSR